MWANEMLVDCYCVAFIRHVEQRCLVQGRRCRTERTVLSCGGADGW